MVSYQIKMNYWLVSILPVISTCTATKILYILPDNVSDVNCPAQPCATLGQYLLDNGSLPVLSDVEYHFLPGEHHVVNNVDIEKAFNFSLIGFGLSPAKLVCISHYFVGVSFSFNVTIRNLAFSQCNGVLYNNFTIDQYIVASLLIYNCSHCKVEDVKFFGYGFAGINLFLNSYFKNIVIEMTEVKPTYMCSRKILLMLNTEHYYINNSVLIDHVSISGYNEICYYRDSMAIIIYKSYGVTVKLYNLLFRDMSRRALFIQMQNTNALLLIKNCSFTYIMFGPGSLERVVYGVLSFNNVIIKFENCKFHYNVVLFQLELNFMSSDGLCVHPSNVTIENCEFTGNYGGLIHLRNVYIVHSCQVNVFFNGTNNFTKNYVSSMLHFTQMAVVMSGMIVVSENNASKNIFSFKFCNITFTNKIIFLSNICQSVIFLTSLKHLPYVIVMEYANITFINITYRNNLIFVTGPVDDYLGVFPHCIFQYMVSTNDTLHNTSELLKLYTINFSGNKEKSTYSTAEINSPYDFLTHCNWLSTAVFRGYDPAFINQHIIQVDGRQWINHKKICYCPRDGPYDCTIDQLGPVYPGQRLQVDLCIPQAHRNYIVIVETHAITLPPSACKLAHQTEFMNSVGNDSKTLNLTIVSAHYEVCELFLISHQLFRSAFYVQLLPCPVGFTLQNGACDCDPFLPPDIDTCYIDLSAIRRPANTWITAHTLTNNITNYLISDCPMDYCLSHSINVNLLHPDLQCQFNRTGILCSQCPHPLSMVFASSRCIKCTNVHILITIIVIVAGIVLVVLLYVLNLTVTNGTINGIIFYANIVSINDSVFLVNDNVFKPLRVFISFANLDLGIETCFYNGMDSYAKMWLQLLFPSYLVIIAVSIIIASRYSSRILRLTYSRSLPVLATLFLLSYTGVLRVVLTVLFSYSTITHYPRGDKQIVWSIDASIPLFGLKFTTLFITCLVLFLILIPFNITLLFTKYLSRFRVVNYFKPLIDAFQGSYKDKYYYWVAVHMIFRSIFFSLYAFQVKLRLTLATIILVVFTAYYGYFRPNKTNRVTLQELLMLINLTIMYAVSIQDDKKIFSITVNVMMSLALLQFSTIILCHFLVYTFHCSFTIKEKLMILFTRKKSNHSCSYNIALLDIPERTYNYSEYQDGLVSDDFEFK